MRSPSQGWRTGWFALGLVVIGVVASIVAGLFVASDNAAAAERWLDDRGEVIEVATEGTVKTAIDGLSGLAAFFENSEKVTQDEFEGFVASLDPVIRLLGVAYMPVVPVENLDAYVADRQTLDPGYSLNAFDADGDLRPVSLDRPVYYPVEIFHTGPLLLESIADTQANVAALSVGYDAGSPVEWRPSLDFSVARDSPAVSAFLDVGVGANMVGKAFIVSVPVHDEEGTVVGLVAAPMVDLLLSTESDPALTTGVAWTVSSGVAAPAEVDGPVWEHEIELPGTVWSLVVVPTDDSVAGLSGIPPWLVVLTGLVITGLVTFLFLLASQRSRARAEMQEMERLAYEKDRFLASVSHEIRTPLTVVAGLAHELRDHPRTFKAEEGIELLSMIVRQSDEVAAIVEDLLVAARADLSKVTIAARTVDLGAQVTRVLEGFGGEFPVTGEPGHVWADPARVRQILRNLVSNARRYGGPNKEIRLGSGDGEAWVEVIDSGPPIPVEDRMRIFDAYVSSSAGSEPGVGGLGLGLFISQRLAELLGGRLSYRHDGSFSIFRLRIPASEKPASQEPASESAA